MNRAGEKGLESMSRMTKNSWMVIVLASTLFLWGCLSLERKTPSFFYYTLEYAVPQIPGIKPLNAAVYVERFVANPPYDTDRMIYRQEKFERDAYLYHRWRTRPAEMISFLLARDLRASRVFHRVYREYLPPVGGYKLKGVVEDFLEWDSREHKEAVLRLRIILSKGNASFGNEKSLFEKTYLARKIIQHENPNGLAQAMSQALKEVSGAVIKDIYHVLEKQDTSR